VKFRQKPCFCETTLTFRVTIVNGHIRCTTKQLIYVKEDDIMRSLSHEECRQVAGGHNVCTPADAMNDYYGIQNTTTFGQDLVNIYEGLVFATSHIIERVAYGFRSP
jgi:hypothetical protein